LIAVSAVVGLLFGLVVYFGRSYRAERRRRLAAESLAIRFEQIQADTEQELESAINAFVLASPNAAADWAEDWQQ
jgi:hypothetical protein